MSNPIPADLEPLVAAALREWATGQAGTGADQGGHDQSEADLYARIATLIANETPAVPAPAPDAWLSLLRGRLLAAASSGVGLYFAGSTAWAQWQHLRAEGLNAENAGALIAQAGGLWDNGAAVILAVTSAVSLLAAGVSWLRGHLKHRAG